MKRLSSTLLAATLVALPLEAVSISGDYVEARTSDVYTGPCFANSEVNLTGHEAILAWRVEEGSWEGVPLAGLGVVAVVRASATLGDPHAEQLPTRSVVLVDDEATPEQRRALVAFVRDAGGELLHDVVAIETAAVDIEVAPAGVASVAAGGLAVLRTRGLNETDHLCGNEEIYYPPLIGLEKSLPAVTLEHTWSGHGLDSTWRSPGKRSAFVGTFTR